MAAPRRTPSSHDGRHVASTNEGNTVSIEKRVECGARRVASSHDGKTVSIEKRFGYCWDQDEQTVRVYLQPAVELENVLVDFHRSGFHIAISHEGLSYQMSMAPLFGPIDPQRCKVRTRSGGSYVVLRLAKEKGALGEWPGLRDCDQIARDTVLSLTENV